MNISDWRLKHLLRLLLVAVLAIHSSACGGPSGDELNSAPRFTCARGFPVLTAGVEVDVHDSLLSVRLRGCLTGVDTLDISMVTCATDVDSVVAGVDADAALLNQNWLSFELPYGAKPALYCEFSGGDDVPRWFVVGTDSTWENLRSKPDSCLHQQPLFAGEACEELFKEVSGMFVSARFDFFQ